VLKTVAERFAVGLAIIGRSVSEILDGTDRVLDGDGSLAARVAAYERADRRRPGGTPRQHRRGPQCAQNSEAHAQRKDGPLQLDRTQFVDSGDE
jgi:hypothetical protein